MRPTSPPPGSLSLLEVWLEARVGITPYPGSIRGHYLEGILYPDIPLSGLVAGGVIMGGFDSLFSPVRAVAPSQRGDKCGRGY